jgi:hypothetical protein
MEPNWAQVVAAIAAIVGAVASSVIAVTAICALSNWQRTLKHERADECLSAARDLEGAVGKYVDLSAKDGNPDQRANRRAAYDGMWASRRNFDKAFAVARRYHKLPDDLPNKTFETLKKFNLDTLGDENQSIKAEMEKLLVSTTVKLGSGK